MLDHGSEEKDSKFREPAKKAVELPLDTIKFLVQVELVAHSENVHLINPLVLRTLFRTVQ